MAKRKTAKEVPKLATIRGERVRELRERRGWSQTELAFRAGMHTGWISQVETGGRDLRTRSFLRLVVALETSADYLLGLTDSAARSK